MPMTRKATSVAASGRAFSAGNDPAARGEDDGLRGGAGHVSTLLGMTLAARAHGAVFFFERLPKATVVETVAFARLVVGAWIATTDVEPEVASAGPSIAHPAVAPHPPLTPRRPIRA